VTNPPDLQARSVTEYEVKVRCFQEKLKLCENNIESVFTLIIDFANVEFDRWQKQFGKLSRHSIYGLSSFWSPILGFARDGDPKITRSIRRLIDSGAVPNPHDFEFLLRFCHGSLKEVAATLGKYERPYWLISVMRQRGLVDDVKASACQLALRHAIRINAPVELTEIALLKAASGRLIDVEKFCTRMGHGWLKPPAWHYFGESNSLPKSMDTKLIEEVLSGSELKDVLAPRRVSWEILPPGKHPFPELVKHFERLQKGEAGSSIDEERLRKLCEFELTDTYTGSDDFRRYIVFDYSRYGFAILECPFVGNAVYILIGDWKELSRLSKAELLNLDARDTMRITHRGAWFDRLNYVVYSLRAKCDVLSDRRANTPESSVDQGT
jgi:hypothetical protein